MVKGNITMEKSTPIREKRVTLNTSKTLNNVQKDKKTRVNFSTQDQKQILALSKIKRKKLVLKRPLSEFSIVGNIKRGTRRQSFSPTRKYSLYFKGQIANVNAIPAPERFKEKKFVSPSGDKFQKETTEGAKNVARKQSFSKRFSRNISKSMVSMTLAQDEQLEEVNKLHGRWQKAKVGAEFTRKSGQLGAKTARFGMKKGGQVSRRTYTFMKKSAVKNRSLAQVSHQVSHKVSYAVTHPVQTAKSTFSAVKAVASKLFATLGKGAAVNPITWIAVGFGTLLLVVVSIVAFIAAIVVIKQDEFDLSESYAYFTEIDAKHNGDGNEFYTDPDDVMVYMNYKFDSYKLGDKVTYKKPGEKPEQKEGTYKDYLSDLWIAMNGEKDNYFPTDISTLYDVEPYKLSSKEQEEVKEMTRDGKFLALQELTNPFGKEGDTLQISRRYGYEKKEETF